MGTRAVLQHCLSQLVLSNACWQAFAIVPFLASLHCSASFVTPKLALSGVHSTRVPMCIQRFPRFSASCEVLTSGINSACTHATNFDLSCYAAFTCVSWLSCWYIRAAFHLLSLSGTGNSRWTCGGLAQRLTQVFYGKGRQWSQQQPPSCHAAGADRTSCIK